RTALISVLACWLGLIAWSSWSPGGVLPAPKTDPDVIRVVTWNILHGTERGLPWDRFGWPVRKAALGTTLEAMRPDLLCVQEALPGQVMAVASMLPGHRRVGVGRDDGGSKGEHCAIYLDRGRFEQLDAGTFWLEQPIDQPPPRFTGGPRRICTWVRLRDRRSGRCLRVYNTHFPLTAVAQEQAARVILGRIALGDPTDAVLVAGDFNAGPGRPCRRLFDESGLQSSAVLAGESSASPTYQFYGIRLRSLDEILVDRGWRVVRHRVLDVKPANTFPSDHFGVLADLRLPAEASSRPSRSGL
ncbi:MAG TPA: endonuclease/exonuclease/phosphatase family protein, partial [Isosphaeraceae bacterium]|nr:endonuclease/exonuclease/phosphatase family protein [Isosphaeraceae bacterium]